MNGSLNREEAAEWVSKVTGARVASTTVRHWETVGILPPKRPGNRIPAEYRYDDLIRLRLVVELRREGVPVERVRRAARNMSLAKLGMHGVARLAVLASGDIVPAGQVPFAPGWLFLFNVSDYNTEVIHALMAKYGRSPVV